MTTLLDASALLASLNEENGADVVESALSDAAISTVNVAEVAGKLSEYGWDQADIAPLFEQLQLTIIAFDLPIALLAGQLRPLTRSIGLSLGDRACMATALICGFEVLTADQSWLTLKLSGLTVKSLRY